MKNYVIEDAKYGKGEGGRVAEVLLVDSFDSAVYISLVENNKVPAVYRTPQSVFNMLVQGADDDDFLDYLEENGTDIESYADIFDNQDPEWYDAYRYLVYIVRAGEKAANSFIASTKGKQFSKIVIPASDVEEELYGFEGEEIDDGFTTEGMDKQMIFRHRLAIETDLARDTVFHHLNENIMMIQESRLERVCAAILDDNEYTAWTKFFIDTMYEKIKSIRFVVCTYLFNGIGQYEEILPEDSAAEFKKWVENQNAFYGGEREANEEEIRQFIALHAVK